MQIRCLFADPEENAFFRFKQDMGAEKTAAMSAETPTEWDAVDVTGLVTGFNVDGFVA